MSVLSRSNRPESWLAAVSLLLLRIVLAISLAYVLYRVGFVIVVVLMAGMLALAVAPVVRSLERIRPIRLLPRHARRGVATTIVFLALGLLLVALGFMIARPLALEIAKFRDDWPAYQTRIEAQIAGVQEWYSSLPPQLRQWIAQQEYRDIGSRVGAQLQELAHRTVESGMLLVEFILIPVLAFSFLTEGRPLKREFASFLPRERVRDGLYVLRQCGVILQSYAVGQLILAAIAGVVVWILMTALHIPYALALAVVAAATRVIPVVGPIFGGIPIILISALQGWDKGLIVLIAFTLMHLVESKVIMPRVIGYRINLHPAIVIVTLLIGAEFFGMWGMFLAAPVAAVVKAMAHHFFVRPRLGGRRKPPPRAPVPHKEPEVERPAVAGVRSHSGAH